MFARRRRPRNPCRLFRGWRMRDIRAKRREMVREAGRHDRWSWPTPESLIEQWVDSSLDRLVSVPRSLSARVASYEAEFPF